MPTKLAVIIVVPVFVTVLILNGLYHWLTGSIPD